jgi:hypothetical protein
MIFRGMLPRIYCLMKYEKLPIYCTRHKVQYNQKSGPGLLWCIAANRAEKAAGGTQVWLVDSASVVACARAPTGENKSVSQCIHRSGA